MYRKPTNPHKREATQQARRLIGPAMCEAMRAARIAAECGLMVLAAHAIDGRPKIVVAAQRAANHLAGQIEAAGITIEWRS